jgi:hypothetical protein
LNPHEAVKNARFVPLAVLLAVPQETDEVRSIAPAAGFAGKMLICTFEPGKLLKTKRNS